MLQSIHWQATDTLARAQFAVFHEAGDVARLTDAERRAALRLNESDWAAWVEFVQDGPLPASPALPDMLCRLAMSSHRMVSAGEPAAAR
jgi:hypothetical protein